MWIIILLIYKHLVTNKVNVDVHASLRLLSSVGLYAMCTVLTLWHSFLIMEY